jgi:hypothetical protein
VFFPFWRKTEARLNSYPQFVTNINGVDIHFIHVRSKKSERSSGNHHSWMAWLPVAMSAYPDEIFTAPQSWTEKTYPKLIHYNRLPKGRHFAAWEQPEFFVQELRTSFRPLRKTLRGAGQ